jgi:ATP phosphoribosyltransferase
MTETIQRSFSQGRRATDRRQAVTAPTLRVSLPVQGHQVQPSRLLLETAGFPVHPLQGALSFYDPSSGTEFLNVSDQDAFMLLDRKVTGAAFMDIFTLMDHPEFERYTHVPLSRPSAGFLIGSRPGAHFSVLSLQGRRVVTSHPVLLSRFLAQEDVNADVIPFHGSLTDAVHLGVADFTAGIVPDIQAFQRIGMETIGPPLAQSQLVLVSCKDAVEGVSDFRRRVEFAFMAGSSLVLEFTIPGVSLDAALAALKDSPAPLVLFDADGDATIRAQLGKDSVFSVMTHLGELGAYNLTASQVTLMDAETL